MLHISFIMKKQYVIFFVLISIYLLYFVSFYHEFDLTSDIITSSLIIINETGCNFVPNKTIKTANEVTCDFPRLDPFDQNILKYAPKPANTKLTCPNFEKIIFSMSLNGTLIQEIDPAELEYSNCCYKVLTRKNENDINYSNCTKIDNKETIINDEYISVYCEKNNTVKNVDYFSTVNLQSFRSKNPKKSNKTLDGSYNVLILGMDSFSNMNLQRTLAASFKYLKEKLNAFTFNGFTKVGEGTFPNVIPMITGNHYVDLKQICLPTLRQSYFDNCSYIWDDFSENNFITFYIEEDPVLSAFNLMKKGFIDQPTDFYIRPFTLGMYRNVVNSKFCFGPRLSFDFLLDYIKKTAFAFKGQKEEKYFQLIWESILTHPNMNNAYYADESVLETLVWLNDNGHLNETILIVVSDHGMRWGDIRKTRQGKFEERMPFLSISFPQSFYQKYTSALKYLKLNGERLITHFDIYATLKDLANIENIENEMIEKRIADFKRKRDISLFLPIPLDRNCEEAGIHSHWCVCDPIVPVPTHCPIAVKSAETLLLTLNKLLAKSRQCEVLTLGSILEGVEKFSFPIYDVDGDTKKEEIVEIRIGISTLPGQSTFEATIQYKNGTFSVMGGSEEISRTNVYGDQSWCVDDKELKKFCYCRVQH